MRCQICFTLLLLCSAFAGQAATIHVPDDQPTIQAGIDAAEPGDEVIVACGSYYEHDIVMKSGIQLSSETGEAACVTIQAEGLGRVLYCEGLAEGTRIRGFTLTGGRLGLDDEVRLGGGVFCGDHSSPIFESCIIRDNVTIFGAGGGMFCTNHSSPTLIGVTFEYNGESSPHHGGPRRWPLLRGILLAAAHGLCVCR